MFKKDMLGPVTRALVGVPQKKLGLMLDIANRLGSTDAEDFCSDLAKFVRDWKSPAVTVDPWFEEKKRIEEFYQKFFNRTHIWLTVVLPVKTEGMKRLEVIFCDITEDEAFAAYAKEFGEDAVWKAWDSISKAIKSQQDRPAGNYAISHVGGEEPDMLNMSYDDGINGDIKFMTPKEGMIAAFRYRVETGNMWDIKGLTRLAALDHDGDAMLMYRNADGQFFMSNGHRFYRYPQHGLREVVLPS